MRWDRGGGCVNVCVEAYARGVRYMAQGYLERRVHFKAYLGKEMKEGN